MSYTQQYMHIIYSTKGRMPALKQGKRTEIFKYMHGIMIRKNCKLFRLNGVEDHVHMFVDLHPDVELSGFVRDLKASTTRWIRRERILEHFVGWQREYAAFSKSFSDMNCVIDYIKNQEEHHRRESFEEELRAIFDEEGMEFDERFLD